MAFHIEPDEAAKVEGSVEQCVNATVEACFDAADLNEDGLLSEDEFVGWYTRAGHEELKQSLLHPASASSNRHLAHEIADTRFIVEAGRVLRLDKEDPRDMLSLFEDAADDQGNLTREVFTTVLRANTLADIELGSAEDEAASNTVNFIFDAFDRFVGLRCCGWFGWFEVAAHLACVVLSSLLQGWQWGCGLLGARLGTLPNVRRLPR